MFHEAKARDFSHWRRSARELLVAGVEPSMVSWNGEDAGQSSLALDMVRENPTKPSAALSTVPKSFLARAEVVSCHASSDTWNLLYGLLWRMAVKGERGLLRRASDPKVSEFNLREKVVRRERHKMTAFVRFRKVCPPAGFPEDRETFVAWYELTHDVVRLTAPFFRDRFPNMNWSILTPLTCVHWNGRQLVFSEGQDRAGIPEADELEAYWKTYYASIFNPARLNMRMMEQEMPRRYWKNLPEAEIIAELANGSYGRTQQMQEHAEDNVARRQRKPRGAPDGKEQVSCRSPEEIRLRSEGLGIPALADLARRCQACSLCDSATQTVWGEGPENAALMIVGEQPGDHEDIAGRPFVGPAGQLLEKVMKRAGLNRGGVYLTNAVKHFKWRSSGKRRLHQKPDVLEVSACLPWLQAELATVRPKTVLCLGATAGRAILGRAVSPTRERGWFDDPGRPFRVMLTYHPSFLLRIQGVEARIQAEQAFQQDLALAARSVGEEGVV